MARLEPGDIILSLDRVEVESRATFEKEILAKKPGTIATLTVRHGTGEYRVAIQVGQAVRSEHTAEARPILMLDTGGHTSRIGHVAFSIDGTQLVSVSEDKTIRVWDIQTGKTIRVLRARHP